MYKLGALVPVRHQSIDSTHPDNKSPCHTNTTMLGFKGKKTSASSSSKPAAAGGSASKKRKLTARDFLDEEAVEAEAASDDEQGEEEMMTDSDRMFIDDGGEENPSGDQIVKREMRKIKKSFLKRQRYRSGKAG